MEYATALVNRFIEHIIEPAIYLLISLGLLLFLWGLMEFMMELQKGGDPSKGKQHMIYGLVGMFVMISVYGIIALIANTLGVNPRAPVDTSRLESVRPTGTFFESGE